MLTGKYRQGEKGQAEGMGGRVFQAENSQHRTKVLDTVIAVAADLGVSPDQIAIAWAGTHGAVPMIGPRSLTQLTSNLGATAITLSSDHIERLDAASNLNPDEPTRPRLTLGKDSARKVIA